MKSFGQPTLLSIPQLSIHVYCALFLGIYVLASYGLFLTDKSVFFLELRSGAPIMTATMGMCLLFFAIGFSMVSLKSLIELLVFSFFLTIGTAIAVVNAILRLAGAHLDLDVVIGIKIPHDEPMTFFGSLFVLIVNAFASLIAFRNHEFRNFIQYGALVLLVPLVIMLLFMLLSDQAITQGSKTRIASIPALFLISITLLAMYRVSEAKENDDLNSGRSNHHFFGR